MRISFNDTHRENCVFLNSVQEFVELLLAFSYVNSPPFERSACFYVAIIGNSERFQYFNCEINYLENENPSQKTGVSFFSRKY